MPTPDLVVHVIVSGDVASGKTVLALLMRRFFQENGFINVQLQDIDTDGLTAEEAEHHLSQRAAYIKSRHLLVSTEQLKRSLDGTWESDGEYRIRLLHKIDDMGEYHRKQEQLFNPQSLIDMVCRYERFDLDMIGDQWGCPRREYQKKGK